MAVKYRAIRKCLHNEHFYKVGAYLRATAEELKDPTKIPRHFVREGEFSADKVDEASLEDVTSRKVNVKALKTKAEK